jgi:hypothetical protein
MSAGGAARAALPGAPFHPAAVSGDDLQLSQTRRELFFPKAQKSLLIRPDSD